MQSASTALTNVLKEQHAVYSSLEVIAEWNQNRYSRITSITNGGIEDYDEEMFPITTIALPDRPTRGILKARASAKTRVTGLGADGFTNDGYEDTPRGARYCTADIDSKYKYWTSPGESTGSYANTPASISNVAPAIVYTNLTWSNKIVVGFESSYAQPSIYTIQISTNGTTWTTVSTSPTIPDNGRVEIYRQANGTWSTAVYRDAPLQIRGVKLVVTQMNKSKVFFNLIELSARLESDLSSRTIEYNVENTMTEDSFITPLGTSSANTGSVTLSNFDGLFTNDNTSSIYKGLIDKNVELRLAEGTNIGTFAAPNFEWTRLATMKSGAWAGQKFDIVTVPLYDDAVRLQEIKPNPVFYQSMTVGEIIWRLLDSVGFSNYKYESRDDDPSTLVPFFWTDGDKTIWEIINELSQATQTAVFFDERNVLQIQTRNSAYNLTKAVAWTFDGATNGTKLPDIVDLDKTYDFEANTVNVMYKTTKISDAPNGIPIMESVWEPEGTLALRSTALVNSMTTSSTSGRFDPKDMASWPFAGIVQVQGEFIRYVAKGYTYYLANGTLASAYIKSNDEKIALDKKKPVWAYKNHFNGYLNFSTLDNRGLWNSVPKAHVVDATGYLNRYRTLAGTVTTWNGGFIHDKANSILKLRTNTTFGQNSYYVSTRGSSGDTPPRFFGTRLRFPTSGYSFGAAGLAMSVGSNDAGYFFEVIRTSTLAKIGRKWTNELCFYVRYSDGTILRLGPNGNKGNILAVSPATWYDVDISMTPGASSSLIFSISVNGVPQMTVTVASGQKVAHPLGGRFGLFARGDTDVEFEYLYASTWPGYDAFDEEGYLDRISGGYQSSQLMREWTYALRRSTRIVKKKRVAYMARYNSTLIDEFGPIAHEVREFDVKFSKNPVLHSRLYLSNESQVICPEYSGDAFGAKFILANTARVNAIVSGEDTLTFGAANSVTQHALVYGRTITQADEKKYTVVDAPGVTKRGEVSVDVASDWIQSEAAAKALGSWIIKHWSGGADEVEVSVFGNPLLQLGDLVSVNHTLMDMLAATHKYFIVKVSQSYSSGLSTSVTLRRARV